MGKTKYKVVGNRTECGLINFLWDADIPVQNMINVKWDRMLTSVPFNSTDKISATVVQNPNRIGFVTIYLKGAPEEVLHKCQTAQTHEGYSLLSDDMKEDLY
jgi:magnesium-transporting ATPase (P-type)